jgi:hypothetical protein
MPLSLRHLQFAQMIPGFAGQTPIEEALVDSIVDASVDYQKATGPHFMIVMGATKGDKVGFVFFNPRLPRNRCQSDKLRQLLKGDFKKNFDCIMH